MTGRLRALVADPSVRWLAVARVLALVGAPVTLWLVVTRLPIAARGFYLIAINVAMLGPLFETGMGTLVVQFAAHATPGETAALRAAAERWYARAALLFAVTALVLGALVLGAGARDAGIAFLPSWSVLVVLTAAYIRLVPLVCLREGGGGNVAVQRMRAIQAAALLAALWIGLLSGRALPAAAMGAGAQLGVIVAFVLLARAALKRAGAAAGDEAAGGIAARYRAEQGRSARVWFALWGAPQVLTPAVLWLHGAVAAGDLGLQMALALAPPVLGIAWLHARYPRLGALVAAGRLREFDETARHAFTQALGVFLAATAALYALVLALPRAFPALPPRLVSPGVLAGLLVGSLALVALQAMLAWVRAFADERLGDPVAVACLGMAGGGIFGGAVGGVRGAALGYALVAALVTGIVYAGFRRMRSTRLGPPAPHHAIP